LLGTMETGIQVFDKSILGIHPDPETNTDHANTIIPRLAKLARKYGYQQVTAVCKRGGGSTSDLKNLLDQTFGGSSK
jgi:hypothetical protein